MYIVLISLFLGVIPARKEWLGLFLAIVGCVFIIMDPKATRIESGNFPEVEQTIWPAIIDLASAFFGALYFIMSGKNVKTMPVCFLILLMNMHSWAINGLIAKYQDSAINLFSFDVQTGCLGFMNVADQALLPLFCYALLASFFGSAGYVLCLLFYSPLVTSNAYLLEPFFA
jgi:drug/metabolite transporter (DMT)-like permease